MDLSQCGQENSQRPGQGGGRREFEAWIIGLRRNLLVCKGERWIAWIR